MFTYLDTALFPRNNEIKEFVIYSFEDFVTWVYSETIKKNYLTKGVKHGLIN